MPSKTSFCNGTEFRKCLSRWWPLWVIYGVILFIMLPGVLLNARSTIPYVSAEQISYLSNVILSETQMLLPLTAFCAGLLAAAAMFGYLYTPRGAGLAASLPIRRGCMFRTHLLAGLVMLLSAEVVVFGLAVLIEATRFELVIEPLLIWLGILALETVVFYGIAVLCAMFTGHVVMLPCLYLLVNFIAVGFQLLVETVLYMFVYGMSGMVDLPVDWLSRWCCSCGAQVSVTPIWCVRSAARGRRSPLPTSPAGPIRSSGRRSRCCCSCARVSSTGAAAWRARATPSPSRCSSRC